MTAKLQSHFDFAKQAGLPVIIDGDRSGPTGKSTLCKALRDAGIEAYEKWEIEEGIKKQDKERYLLILLNDQIPNAV